MRHTVFAGLMVALILAAGAGVWIVGRPEHRRRIDPGISRALADERASLVSSLAYDIRLQVPAVRREAIRGEVVATFDLGNASRPLVFDFNQTAERLASITANGQTVPPAIEAGHIVIPASHLRRGRNTVRFEFSAGDEALNRQDEFLYSLFVPARASAVFPCFDQPDLKARWRLSLEVPAGWVAVSNGSQTGRTAARGRVSYLFDETPPLSTYLFAFAAGRFTIETAQRGDRTFRMFHRESDPSRVSRNRDAIFDLHAQSLDWLERYTGIAYPFGKFDFVLIPAFQFSGMEHPGAVLYNANSLLLDESATEQQALSRANVIAHETSHMWFGDLVTMRWFDDVWMKEVFANFMAAKIVNPSFPGMNHDLRFFVQHYPGAYEIDRSNGANPIRQELLNLDDAGSLYGAIIYQKAPIVMRQLERLVGERAFRDVLREYLTQHAFANASWPDLVAMLDRQTPYDLATWSHSWVDQAGRPSIKAEVRPSNGMAEHVTITQTDPRGRALTWTEDLQVAIGRGSQMDIFDVRLDRAEVSVPEASGKPLPDWVLPSAGGLGYGDFVLDTRSKDWLARHAHEIADPVTRGTAFATLWDEMLDGRLAPRALRELMLTALPSEHVELNLQLLLDQTRALFWRFTPSPERDAFAARLEPVLRQGLAGAATTSAKAAWFGAIRSVASLPATITWLEDVWARRRSVPGLPLAEVDESELASELAVRGVANANAILDAQLARITNADRRARFAFIRPALSSEPAALAAYLETLMDVRNRGREAWVIDAARYLHHPSRREASAPLVRPALELTLEIKRTGDIFFPKRWADATLSGYRSAAVAQDVRSFIDSVPSGYPPRLRWVLQSSADFLFRAAAIDATAASPAATSETAADRQRP